VVNLKSRKQLKLIFELIISNKIELSQNRRSASFYFLSLVTNPQKRETETLSFLFDLYNFFLRVSGKKTWGEFVFLTGNEFSTFPLGALIKKLRLDELHIIALLKTIEGFLKGQQPVYFNDIGLSPSKVIELSILLSDENNVLKKEDLIRVELEKDGVTIRTMITRKTLLLIGGQQSNSFDSREFSVKNPFYEVIESDKIQKYTLHYSLPMKNTFKDFCELSRKIKKSENLSLLLYGVPGTGKTAFAHQLAKEVNGIIYQMDFSQIQSKWVGETEKNVNRVFKAYQDCWEKSNKPVILLINEADGLMNKRININSSNDVFSNQIQTELLERLENFNGILIATTNLLNNIDSAFHRRFLFKTEVLVPDNSVRSSYLKESELYALLSENLINQLENASWTIAEIKNVERKINLIQRVRKLSHEDLEELLTVEGVLKGKRQQIGYGFEL
jgi:hypothetical protein